MNAVKGEANNDVMQTLRTAHQNQTQLNLMADQKANILIGTLVLMLTVVLTRLLTSVENQTWVWPLVVFLMVQLLPLIQTVMVLIPKNINNRPAIDIGHIENPLFFGFFTQYSQQQYSVYMHDKLQDNQAARQLIIDDIYQIGTILRRKYRLLRWAYFSALLGMLVPAAVGLIIAFNTR